MRQSSYTPQEIGDHLGVTRERIRQILQGNCGNIEIPLLCEKRVAEELGCTPWRLSKLRKQGILNSLRRGKYFHYYRMDDLGKIKLLLQKPECGTGTAS